MGRINTTRLATSNPLNLNTGFPFFPSGTSLANPTFPRTIGIGDTPTNTFSLFQRSIPLVFWRFRGSVTGSVIAGAFYGFNLGYQVSGETRDNGTAVLTVSSDSARGGLGFGLGMSLTLSLTLEQGRITFSWRSGFRTSWSAIFNLSTTVTFDVIDLTLRILRASGLSVPLDQISDVRGAIGSGAVWGLIDSASSQFSSQGSLTIRPRVNVSGNLLSLVPGLKTFLAGLKKAGAKLHVGPVLNILLPVTITIVRLTTEDGNYESTGVQNGVFNFNRGPRISPTAPPVREVTVTHSHTVGLTFTVDFKASFSVWSIISISATVPLNLAALRPPTANVFGPYFTALSNTRTTAAELPEVVWG